MYNSAFLKMEAKKRLSGNYRHAIVGALIFMIPMYLTYLLETIFSRFLGETQFISVIIDALIQIFVSNIFAVGFMRFLLNMKSAFDTDEKCCDFNDVLSGYTRNFKNTLKTTFTQSLYLFGWGALAFSPMLVMLGIIAFLSVKTDMISQIYSLSVQFMNSPTPDMMNNLSLYITENCPYLSTMSLIAIVATLVLLIPLIYKSYEYIMVPMILAQYPDMETKRVFKRTRDLMHGFRMRYFLLSLSFILWMFLAALVLTFTFSIPLYYLALALLLPYMNMTFLQFYLERSKVIEYNINIYGENPD